MRSLIVTLLMVTVMLAQAPNVRGAEIGRPTGPNGGPTEVQIQVILLDVDEISAANQSFVANFFFAARWKDAKLAHQGPGTLALPLDEVWHPSLQFVSQQKLFPTFPELAQITPDGEVSYHQRVWGNLSQPMELKEFPFDRQAFEIRMVAAGYTPAEVRFVADRKYLSGLSPRLSQPDWTVLQWRLDLTPHRFFEGDVQDASFALVFDGERKKGFFVWKIILPLVLIVAMSWIVFWIDPEQAGTQIGVSMTSMLTLIAYRFMIGGQLPKISYLTRMDYFILGSTLLVFASLVQAAITARLAHDKRTQAAQGADRWCRVIFPVLFLGWGVWSLFL